MNIRTHFHLKTLCTFQITEACDIYVKNTVDLKTHKQYT